MVRQYSFEVRRKNGSDALSALSPAAEPGKGDDNVFRVYRKKDGMGSLSVDGQQDRQQKRPLPVFCNECPE